MSIQNKLANAINTPEKEGNNQSQSWNFCEEWFGGWRHLKSWES